MYVSATDREKLGQVTASVYTSSTEEVLDQLLCQCILFILYLYGTFLEYLRGHCNQKKNYFSQYMEFWINQLRKNTDVYCIYRQFVRWCRGYLGKKVPLPSCVTAVIRQKFNSPGFLGFKYPQI